MSRRRTYEPTLFWAVMVGDHIAPHLAKTRNEARNMVSTHSWLMEARPELCPQKGRARVVRIEVRIVEGGR